MKSLYYAEENNLHGSLVENARPRMVKLLVHASFKLTT